MQYILDYLKRFPQCEEKVLVKIIYQRVFGSTHMLNNVSSAHDQLINEWAIAQSGKINEEFIPISADVIQVNLKNFKNGKELEMFFAKFIASAKEFNGTSKEYHAEIKELCDLVKKKHLPFDTLEIKKLAETEEPLSHSKAFKEAYKPHYRILKKSFY